MLRLVLVLALSQTVYRWTDSKGVVHYTDDPSTAPKGVKVQTTEGAELMEVKVSKTAADKVAERNDVQPAAVVPVPPPPGGELDDEEYWRNAFAQAREKIRQAEEDLATRQKVVDNPEQISNYAGTYCSQGLAAPRAPARYGRYMYAACWNDVKQHLPDAKKAVERAKEELHDLEIRAANASVPLEWRR